MRKKLLFILFILFSHVAFGQKIREELKDDLFRAGSNYYAYPDPDTPLSPAPKGKKPFYISTYARHGSRYLIRAKEYEWPYQVMKKAGEQGKLSEVGKQVLEQLAILREEAKDRYGELTPLGASQHRKIAQRMYNNFPEVFKGKAIIDAKSTVVIRCIISMENELLQLAKNNPELVIRSDASQHDMYYMNLQDRNLYNQKWPKEAVKVYDEYCYKHARHERPMLRLFNDSVYAWKSINLSRLNLAMFKLASSVQGTEYHDKFSIFKDLYTDDELYHNWLQVNAYWYISYGSSPLNGGTQPFSQRNLLKKIIEEADSCIAIEHPGATLRFGHETMVLPLTCLLGINGFDQQVTDLEKLEERGWVNYKVFPMAANLQIVLYRKNPKDNDVLIKVLLNENEATLPIKTDCAPYYHWKDFRDFCLEKLATYKE